MAFIGLAKRRGRRCFSTHFLAQERPYYRETTLIVDADVATPKGDPTTDLSAPLEPMPKAAMSWLIWSVTYTTEVSVSTATAEGPTPPVGKGDPVTAPSAPEVESM